MLNLEYLAHFLTMTKYMSFTVAAEKLFMNQSTLSRQIFVLENECRTPLFERTGHMLKLTEAGLKLQEEGPTLLSLQAQIVSSVRIIADNASSKINIYTVPGFFPSMDRIYKLMRDSHPDIKLLFHHLRMVELATLLTDDVADFGIDYEAHFQYDSKFETRILETEPFVAVCAPDHRFAGKSDVSFEECLSENVLFGADFPLSLRKGNTMVRPTHHPNNLETARYQVMMNEGIVILPCGSANGCLSGLPRIVIRDEDLVHRVVLVYKRDKVMNTACQTLWDEVEKLTL
jgi:DNA-binding transcriptional LysR family regulator